MSVPSRYAGLMAYLPQAPEMQKTPRYSEGSKFQFGSWVYCGMCVHMHVCSAVTASCLGPVVTFSSIGWAA